MKVIRLRVMTTASAGLLALGSVATAQTYPTKPIRIMVGSAAGGNTDLQARLYAQKLTEALGQQVIVDIRAGAAGAIASAFVAKSPPDGYTLMLASTQFLITPLLATDAGYDPLKDFVPVIVVSQAPIVLIVHPSLPATSVTQLIALAKARRAELSYGTGGVGSSNYLAGELFKWMAKVDILHVSYRGSSPAVTALLGGEVHVAFPVLNSVRGYIKGGRLRALGVTTTKRAAAAPDIPTISESGLPGYEATPWAGLTAPRGTPREIIDRLNAALTKAFDNPASREYLMSEGSEFVGGPPENMSRIMQSETDKWSRMLKAINSTPEASK